MRLLHIIVCNHQFFADAIAVILHVCAVFDPLFRRLGTAWSEPSATNPLTAAPAARGVSLTLVLFIAAASSSLLAVLTPSFVCANHVLSTGHNSSR